MIQGGRYHSWVVDPESVPAEMIGTAIDENNNIMGLSHKYYPLDGIQFHPESYMTPMGSTMMKNWLES